jgi:undecaprenyl-diphosphatase
VELISAAVLGIIQGLTEFLPISSSAHLILVPWLLGWKPEGLVFDVSLHVGTALAILAYFWRDWVELAREGIAGIREGKALANPQRRLAWFLVVATLPALFVGFPLNQFVEKTLRSPLITVFTLVFFAGFLYLGERRGRQFRSLEQFTWGDSIWIGLSQAVALIPGVSRSGITIGSALFRNVDRSSAARFSFLLATPVIVGAGLLEGWNLFQALRHPAIDAVEIKWSVLAVGVVFAATSGFLCIRYFLRYLRTGSFLPFVCYRIGLAAVVLIFYLRHWRA